MLDKDNYPDEKDLELISRWDIIKKGTEGLLNLVYANTNYAEEIGGHSSIHRGGKYYEYHTYGWSGIEDVIGALRRNYIFWSMYWQKSTRGGHYYFELEPMFKAKETSCK